MAKLLKLRRGTNTQHSSFTGAEGEVTVNTTNDSLHVHDGSTAGGRELMRADKDNMPTSGVTAGTYGSSSAIPAITVDAKGLVTSATTNAIDSTSITNGTSNVSVASSGNITATRAGTTRLTVTGSGIDVNGSLEADGGNVAGTLTTNRLIVDDDGSTSPNAVFKTDDQSPWAVAIKNDTYSTTESHGLVIHQQNDGDVYLRNAGDGAYENTWLQHHDGTNTRNMIRLDADGSVDLYYQNTKKLETTSSGIDVTGSVTSSGSLLPATDNSYDLGTSDTQWRDGYFDGVVNCDGVTSEGDVNIRTGSGGLILRDNNSSGNAATPYILMEDSTGADKVEIGLMSTSNQNLTIRNKASASLIFATNNADRCYVDSSGHLVPSANNTYDIGSSSLRWRNVYTNDLNLSNEGNTNDVDGTWGSWTIQEGEDDLFLLNRRNGKKYKFNLTEVN